MNRLLAFRVAGLLMISVSAPVAGESQTGTVISHGDDSSVGTEEIGMPDPASRSTATVDSELRDQLSAIAGGTSYFQGEKLAAAIAEADKHPLGSNRNPVRVSQPIGERAYLARLRCNDGNRPQYRRLGSDGGPFGNMVDIYEVTCPQSAPVRVVMDMYHPDHLETRPAQGFALAQ